MFEVLLPFLRASRQGLWKLHLASLNEMVKYFFAHDQINYARLTPVYLATMCDMKVSNPDAWRYLEENFAIAKSDVSFTAIGSDHAMEQENKVLKVKFVKTNKTLKKANNIRTIKLTENIISNVLKIQKYTSKQHYSVTLILNVFNFKVSGGVVGLTQNSAALNRFCLVAPLLASLSDEFCKLQGINTTYQSCRYQLTGSTMSRISDNEKKLVEAMNEFDLAFCDNDKMVFNVVSKAALSPHAWQILRFHGSSSIWFPMKKIKIKSFKENNKKLTKKVGEKVIQLREEKTLLTRFLITARKRLELDLEESFGNYEFSVVPKALFSSDGQPLTCTEKSSVLHHITMKQILLILI